MSCREIFDFLFLLCALAAVPYVLLSFYLVSFTEAFPGGRFGTKIAWWPFHTEMKNESPACCYWARISLYMFFALLVLLLVRGVLRLC